MYRLSCCTHIWNRIGKSEKTDWRIEILEKPLKAGNINPDVGQAGK